MQVQVSIKTVIEARNGNANALNEIVEGYYGYIATVVNNMVSSGRYADYADDLIQDACLMLVQQFKVCQATEINQFTKWVRMVVRSAVLHFIQKSKVAKRGGALSHVYHSQMVSEEGEPIEIESEFRSPDDIAAAREEFDKVLQLASKHDSVVGTTVEMLRDGHSLSEVAGRVGLTQRQVSARYTEWKQSCCFGSIGGLPMKSAVVEPVAQAPIVVKSAAPTKKVNLKTWIEYAMQAKNCLESGNVAEYELRKKRFNASLMRVDEESREAIMSSVSF